jgi:hypothetical protein
MNKLLGCLLVISGLLIFSAAAVWADAGASESDRWQLTIEPYMWTPQLGGSVTVNDVKTKVKFDLTDYFNIIDEIKMILMGKFTIQKDRFAIFYDGMYAKLEDEINSGGSAEITSKQLIQELGGSFEVADWAVGGVTKENLRFDVLGGARHIYLRSEGTAANPLGMSHEADKTRQWVDPFIGGKLTLALTEKTSVSLRGDVGGFGVSSGFIWNGELLLKHFFNKNWFTTMGYRGMNTDYEDGSFKYQIDYYGPVTSMGCTF